MKVLIAILLSGNVTKDAGQTTMLNHTFVGHKYAIYGITILEIRGTREVGDKRIDAAFNSATPALQEANRYGINLTI